MASEETWSKKVKVLIENNVMVASTVGCGDRGVLYCTDYDGKSANCTISRTYSVPFKGEHTEQRLWCKKIHFGGATMR